MPSGRTAQVLMNMTGDLFSTLQALAQRPADLPAELAFVSLLWAFIIGACWGSFTNVVIARVPEGKSVVFPRSRCPSCSAPIRATDNIPVLSWLLLRGRCRACGASIAMQYVLVEVLLGLLAAALVARHGWNLAALELFVFALILVAIAFVDIKTWTVPHPLWIALTASGLTFGVVTSVREGEWGFLVDRLMGAAGAGLFFAALVVISTGILRRTGRLGEDQMAMGWGDPLIVVGIGASLGWRMLPLVVFFASFQGALVGAVLKSFGHLRGEEPVSDTDAWVPPAGAVPFGPFLALGALEAAFFGEQVMALVRPLFSLGSIDVGP